MNVLHGCVLALSLFLRPAAGADAERRVVLFLGDSLTAGYGVEEGEAYPALLRARWRRENSLFTARNAGASGATTADLAANLDWHLSADVAVLFLAAGANDGLRGLPLEASRKNLSAVIEAARKKKIRVVLAGMKIPPNYGAAYAKSFETLYPSLARRYGLKLLPFLLEGVAGKPQFNISDGIHPNAAGHRLIAERVAAFFAKERLLR